MSSHAMRLPALRLLKNSSHETAYLLFIAALTIAFFLPTAYLGTHGPWFLDSNKLTPITDYVTGDDVDVAHTKPMNPRLLGRQLGFGSFVLEAQLTGSQLDPATSKTVNVGIHLACSVLLFLLIRWLVCLSRYRNAATIITVTVIALWTLSPANLGTAFYAVQRLAQLSSLFMITGLLAYVALRSSTSTQPRKTLTLISAYLISLVLGLASKENAANLILFTLVTECLFFGFRNPYVRPRTLGAVVLSFFFVAGTSSLFFKSGYLDYSDRSFTLIERVLTQLRVLPMYIADLVLPYENATGLLKQVQPSSNLLNPITTAFGLLALFAYLAAVFYSYTRGLTLIAFGLTFFAVGHLIESSIFPLEMHFRHRNYLPSAGLYLALVTAGYDLAQRFGRQQLIGLIACLYIAFMGTATYARATAWSSDVEMGAAAYRYNPDGYRAASYYSYLLVKAGKPDAANEIIDAEIAAHPENDFIYRLQSIYYSCTLGRPLRGDVYGELATSRNNARDIEVSRALGLLIQSGFEENSCPGVNPKQLASSLGQVAEAEHRTPFNPWIVHYYRVRLLRVTSHDEEADQLLLDLLEQGYNNAGLMLADHYLRQGLDDQANEVLSRLEKDLPLETIEKFGIGKDRLDRDHGIIFQ